MKKLVLPLFLVLVCIGSEAQDTLPKFTVQNAGSNRNIISWFNRFHNIKQLSIQRSVDSLTNFKTILTVPDPTTPQNGYVDSKANNDRVFYRIYILLERGVFIFSPSKRPEADPERRPGFTLQTDRIDKLRNGIDSINNPNFGVVNNDKPNAFRASLHVYTYSDGYVRINLPDDENKKYNIKFFEDDGSFIFELKEVKTRTFKIDKSNFYHAGWFRFELYENGKLIEKHKFFLEKDF